MSFLTKKHVLGRAVIKAGRTRWIQRILLPIGRSLKPERWIFVVGCYNSGTTLLANVLAKHPQIGGMPEEGAYLTDSLPIPERFGWTRMWYKCLDSVRIQPDSISQKKVKRIKKHWSLWFPVNKPNLLEKSPSNVSRMPFLQRYFHPAYFIYIIRNGYSVAEGIRRKAVPLRWGNSEFGKQYPLALCAEQWQATDKIVCKDRDKIHRIKHIYYEDFVRNPLEILDNLTDFLGIQKFPSPLLNSSWRIHEKNSVIRNMNSDSFARLSEEDIDIIEKVAGDTLCKHGYFRPK